MRNAIILKASTTQSRPLNLVVNPLGVRRIQRFGVFKNNSYIRLLNHILQNEKGASQVYHLYAQKGVDSLSAFHDDHDIAFKIIQKMIFSNSGLADTGQFRFPSDFSVALAHLTPYNSPRWIKSRTTSANCISLERYLLARYQQAYFLAPSTDRRQLYRLIRTIKGHIARLADA